MRSSYTSLSISAPFYGYLKLLKLHRTERSRSKDVKWVDRTWDLLHKGRALTDCAILAPILSSYPSQNHLCFTQTPYKTDLELYCIKNRIKSRAWKIGVPCPQMGRWVVTEKFRDYLYYFTSVTVYTDNNPLTYVLLSNKLSTVGHQRVAELADFNFNIKYWPGKSNID